MPVPMEVYVVDYVKGMNKDLNTESIQGQYFDCENFRIFSNLENSGQGLTPPNGTKLLFNLEDYITEQIQGPLKIIGACNIRDLVVLFVTYDTTEQGGPGWIMSFSVDKVTHALSSPVTVKYYSPDLKFTTKHPIEAHGHYENAQKQFVYFSDYYEETRCVNIATIQLSDPIESLGLFINISLPKPSIKTIDDGGTLPVGIYEIACYFNTPNGKKSLYTPNSNQVHIVEDSESEPSGNTYDGSLSINSNGDTIFTSKSISINIDLTTLPTTLFTSVSFVSIFKSDINQTPVITHVETINIGSQTSIDFVYTNNENSSYYIPYEEYLLNVHPFYTNKTFSILKSQLTVSNIKTNSYDIEWDTKTVRWNNDIARKRNNFDYTGDINNNPYNDESGKANNFRPNGTFDDWDALDQFLYQSDQSTVGGENLDGTIKYRFTLESFLGDESNNYKSCYVNNSGQQTYVVSGNNLVNEYFPDYNSPITRTLRQYKRGEVYRFGLVGFKNGKSSFVKIIGDIKFPDVSTIAGHLLAEDLPTPQTTFVTASLQGTNTYLHPLGIEFTITIPTSVDVDYIQIVRVPRKDKDKTRVAQGVISKFFMSQDAGGANTGVYLSMSDINDIEQYYASGIQPTQAIGLPFRWQNLQSEVDMKRLVSFFTPEASFEYLYPERKNTDYLKTVGLITDTQKDNRGDSDSLTSVLPTAEGWGGNIVTISGGQYVPLNGNAGSRRLLYTKGRSTSAIPNYTKAYHREKVKAAKLVNGFFGPDTDPDTFDGLKIRNYSFENSNNQGNTVSNGQGAYSGTCLLCRLENDDVFFLDPFEDSPLVYADTSITEAPWLNYRYKAFLVDYTRLVGDQYGGISENQFEFNEFIPVSDPIYTSGVYRIFEGDTFITMFNFMKNYWDNNNGGASDNDSFFESVVFPVETSINTELNLGNTFLQGTGGYDHDDDGNYDVYRSQEQGNKNKNMFTYNKIFSNWLINRPYFSKPISFVENLIYDVRTYLSLNKIIGEEINSWCRFPINSFNDVIATYGPINRTHYFLNQLFFLQDNAVGYITVNPRAIVGTSDGVPTELGTALGLQDFFYVSIVSGSIHQKASLVIDQILYYYDGINRKLQALTGKGTSDLGEILGMDSWFRNLGGYLLYPKLEGGDNPIEYKGVHMAYDNENEEIYITFTGNFYATPISLTTNRPLLPGEYVEYLGVIYLINNSFNPYDYIDFRTNILAALLLINGEIYLREPTEYSHTLIYSPLYKSFRDFRPHVPGIYFTDNNFIFSSDYGTGVNLYNYGNIAEYFGTVYPSTLSFITNDKPISNKVLGWMEYSLTVKDENGIYKQNEGLDAIQITNDYQDTGSVGLVGRQKQRFRKWRIKVPRDVNSSNSLARIRGDWFKTKLTYNNALNRSINLERVEVVYQPQNY